MSFLTDVIDRTAPRAFGLGVKIVPAPAIALAGALTANLLLGRDQPLTTLSGSRICLEVTTPHLVLGFVIRGGRLWPAPPSPWDVCIRGEMPAFLALLLQTEDADALFFDRRLAVEGETEIALQIRHALEGAIYRRQKWVRTLFKPDHR
ncbi:MAG: ubiquinone anaerobic biosynthesis accessory factor UbiT [Acidiferrobacter sp.]